MNTIQKKICYVDMDGVLADFELAIFSTFPELNKLTKGTPEMAKAIDHVCLTYGKRIFHDLRPMAYAIEAFHILCYHYEVYILSTPMWIVPESYTDKRLWVERVLGINAEKKLILSHNKGLCRGDYLIDDRIKHGVEEFQGEHIHFGQAGFEDWIKVLDYLATKDNFNPIETPIPEGIFDVEGWLEMILAFQLHKQ